MSLFNEDFTKREIFENIPTVNEILNDLDNGSLKTGRHEFLIDVFRCTAIAISNGCCFDNNREKEYLKIINKYDKDNRNLIVNIFSKIYLLLSNQIYLGFNDYLGELYMKSETNNSKAGQFFTPYALSKTCAEMTLYKKNIDHYINNDKIITLNESACGSGGMILAVADILYNKYHFNFSRNLFVVCSDIDERCVIMTYLQLSLAGVPAIILHQDTLSLKTWDIWKTPAYIMQYTRFKDLKS